MRTGEYTQKDLGNRKEEITQAIAKELKVLGCNFKLRKSANELKHDAVPDHFIDLRDSKNASVYVRINIGGQERFNRWNGKMYVTVDTGYRYGLRRFPERKDGFDYVEIAKAIVAAIKNTEESTAAHLEALAERERADVVCKSLHDDYPEIIGDSVYGSHYNEESSVNVRLENTGRTDNFCIQIRGLDEEHVRALLTALRSFPGI